MPPHRPHPAKNFYFPTDIQAFTYLDTLLDTYDGTDCHAGDLLRHIRRRFLEAQTRRAMMHWTRDRLYSLSEAQHPGSHLLDVLHALAENLDDSHPQLAIVRRWNHEPPEPLAHAIAQLLADAPWPVPLTP